MVTGIIMMMTRHFLLIRGGIVEIWKDIKGYEGKWLIKYKNKDRRKYGQQ